MPAIRERRAAPTRAPREPVPDRDPLLTVDDMRVRLGNVSRPRAYAVMAEIPGRVRIGRSVRIPESAWLAFVASGGTAAA